MIGWSIAAWFACVLVVWAFIAGATRKPSTAPRKMTLREARKEAARRAKRRNKALRRAARERGAL